MATIPTLPEPIAEGLRKLADLPEDVFDRLLTAFRALPLEIRQHRVFPDIPNSDFSDRTEVIKDALFALLLSRGYRQIPVDDIVDAVVRDPGFDASHVDRLKLRTKAVLEIDTLDLI